MQWYSVMGAIIQQKVNLIRSGYYGYLGSCHKITEISSKMLTQRKQAKINKYKWTT